MCWECTLGYVSRKRKGFFFFRKAPLRARKGKTFYVSFFIFYQSNFSPPSTVVEQPFQIQTTCMIGQPLKLACFLLGGRFYTSCNFFTCLWNDR